MKTFNRNDAFSMEIKDPDNIEEVSTIVDTFVIDENLLFFKTKNIFKILTADTIDPNCECTETGHSYEKIVDIGTESEYVARVIIQAQRLLGFIAESKDKKDELLSEVWELNQLLLNCRSVILDLECTYSLLIPQIDDIIEKNKKAGLIPALPKIANLNSKVRVFLTNAKLFLIGAFKFIANFYPISINDYNESHFNQHIDSLILLLGEEHDICKLLTQDLSWIRLISECRNAIEHSKEGQNLTIVNFALQPGNKYSIPVWTFDLTKKLSLKQGPHLLLNDLDVFCSNMLHLFEDLLVLSIQDELKEKTPWMSVYKLKDSSINDECPLRFDVTLTTNVVS